MTVIPLGHSPTSIRNGTALVETNADGTISITGSTTITRVSSDRILTLLSAGASQGSGLAIGRTAAEADLAVSGSTGGFITGTVAGDLVLVVSASTQELFFGLGSTIPLLRLSPAATNGTGIQITGALAGSGVTLAAVSSGAAEALKIDAKGTGTLTLQGTATGAITLGRATGVTGALTVTSTGASALAVGAAGATNPVLQVDASVASVATGIKITGAAAAGGVTIAAISSGADEALTLASKAAASLILATNSLTRLTVASTGAVTIAAPTSGVGLTVSGGGAAITGDSTVTGTLAVVATLTALTSFTVTNESADVNPPAIFIKKGRVGPAAVQSGDQLSTIASQGHDGTSYSTRARIGVWTTQLWDADSHGTYMAFQVTPDDDASAIREIFRITASGAAAGTLTLADAIDLVLNTTTGTKIGTAANQKLGFWGDTPIVQPTTAYAAATFAANTSLIANDTATWDGYTIGALVGALRGMGILA